MLDLQQFSHGDKPVALLREVIDDVQDRGERRGAGPVHDVQQDDGPRPDDGQQLQGPE